LVDELSTDAQAILIKAATDSVMTALIQSGAIKGAKTQHTRVNWERVMAWEWGEMFYKDYPKWYRVEIGAIPGGNNDPLYSRTRRYADLIIHKPDETLIVEFKMKAIPDVAGQLKNYKILFPDTPMLKRYANLPIRLILVCAIVDDQTRTFIEELGIEIVVYRPKNFEDWFKFVIEKDRNYQNKK